MTAPSQLSKSAAVTSVSIPARAKDRRSRSRRDRLKGLMSLSPIRQKAILALSADPQMLLGRSLGVEEYRG
jgi:hypothetical protein